MPESIETFLADLNNRYPVDERFRRNIRPLVERIFDQSISSDERRRLLNLVEQTYKRQVENRENLERAKEGIRRIFSNLYRKILKDLGPQMGNLNNRMDEGTEASPSESTSGSRDASIESDHPADKRKLEDGDRSVPPGKLNVWEPRPLKPHDPVWGEQDRGDASAHQESDAMPRKKDVLFGEFLVKRGVLDRAALLGALEEQVREKPLLGWVGLRRGVLTEEQVLTVLTRQVREDRRFGEIAVEEGYLDSQGLDVLCRVQKKYTPLLGRILVSRGDLSRDALEYFLEEFSAGYGQ
jgi:hypothetical protein